MNKVESMKELSTVLNCNIEIWGNDWTKNDKTLEDEKKPKLLKKTWAAIIPQTARLQKAQVDTLLTKATHKIKIRHIACKELVPEMWVMHKNKKYEIIYPLNPYMKNEWWEFFAEEVIE